MFSIAHLNELRAAELEVIVPNLPIGGRVLEIGAGTGQQALLLQRRGFDVAAVDLAGSAYAGARVFPVAEYDGVHLPFSDASFDVVMSSNALEHVRDLAGMHAEIKRVLKPGGVAAHVLPTHAWRFWSIATSFPSAIVYAAAAGRRTFPGSRDRRSLARAWFEAAREVGAAVLQPRHGERGFGLAELWLFHPAWWRKHFRQHGFALIDDRPIGLFYTGPMLFGGHLSLVRRTRLAKRLGSACHLYVMQPAEASVER
jgi:SAM-dependent methyltransferase